MPEQGPSRDPGELTDDTLETLGLDKPTLWQEYTWQQLEAAARDYERRAAAHRQEADELETKAREFRTASEIAQSLKDNN